MAADEDASRLRQELDELRARVDCRSVLEAAAWRLDKAESTRNAAKYRDGPGRIVIVTHAGKGWFDPLAGKRGDALALAQHLWGGNLGHARKALRPLAGLPPTLAPMPHRTRPSPLDAEAEWASAHPLRLGSKAWRYLTDERALAGATVDHAVSCGVLREKGFGTVWARHGGNNGPITGWEMRGPDYKGFAQGGSKTLFLVGDRIGTSRLVVCESAIDALSLAAIEGWPARTLYASTAGGFGSRTTDELRRTVPTGGVLVAATDRGVGGDLLAARLCEIAATAGVGFVRLCPTAKDWNDQLRHG